MKTRHLFAAFALALLSCTRSQAGTLASVGIGGSWQPRGVAARNVRLVELDIRVQLPSRRVEVRSVLRNMGAAATIEMGFPEGGQPNNSGKLPPAGFLRRFATTLDGKPLKVARLAPKGSRADEFDDQYNVMWIARVPFARGQTRTVRDVFTSGAFSDMMNAPNAAIAKNSPSI